MEKRYSISHFALYDHIWYDYKERQCLLLYNKPQFLTHPHILTSKSFLIKYDPLQLSTFNYFRGAYCIKRIFQTQKASETKQMLIRFLGLKKGLFRLF